MIPYKTATALEMAIKAAAKASPQETNRAIAGFYHHRLLCRVFSEPIPPFVLKGGFCLLARTIDARYTRDIDLVTSSLNPDEAVAELNKLAQKDMGDFINFVPKGWRHIKAEDDYRDGYTASYDAYLGLKKIQTVSVDIVSDPIECDSPDSILPADRIYVSGIEDIPYLLYPAERAVADKVCGIIERHNGRVSSRVKDLVDIVIYALTENFENQALAATLSREFTARRIPLLSSFALPEEWLGAMKANYAKAAGLTGIPEHLKDMENAQTVAASLLSLPMCEPEVEATWDKNKLAWVLR